MHNHGELMLRRQFSLLMMGCCAAWACASVSTKTTTTPAAAAQSPSASQAAATGAAYTGPKTRVQVIRFSIPKDVTEKYPELADKNVGWGLCNRIVDALYTTGRFEYIEEKEGMIEKLVEEWKLSQAGIYSSETAIEAGQIKAPEYLIYAEVFDFAVGKAEKIKGMKKEDKLLTRIGIQIRLVEVKTGSYIPASGNGESASQQGGTIWAQNRSEFDQSSIGIASQQAVDAAIKQLLQRFPAK
jgi:curli biogenesis system outer membrane secretion channel CsgG